MATHMSDVLHHDLLELPELLLELAATGRGLDACSPLPECQAVADLDRRVGQPCRDALHSLDGWVSQSEWVATSITLGAQCRGGGSGHAHWAIDRKNKTSIHLGTNAKGMSHRNSQF